MGKRQCTREFKVAFERFKEMSLSENNLQNVINLENSIKEKHEKFVTEIENLVKIANKITVDTPFCLEKLDDVVGKPDSKIRKEWHKLGLKMDLQLNKIAMDMKKTYTWSQQCLCKTCISSKNMSAQEVKRYSEEWKCQFLRVDLPKK